MRKNAVIDDPDDPRFYGVSRFDLRMWHGMTTWAWWRLIRGNISKISPKRYGLVISVTAFSLLNSFSAVLEWLLYSRKIDRTKIEHPPILIIGFQRSGTTFLNELMACDPRLAYPDNFQCFLPESFLFVERTLRPLANLLPKRKRPMDNVDISPDAPQEDEVALLLTGIPSPYRTIAFPSALHEFRKSIEDESDDAEIQDLWNKTWTRFLKKVQLSNPGKRLLLKSPTHTVRTHRISRMLPGSKFIHISRNPYKIFQSNQKLSRALAVTQGLQVSALDSEKSTKELLSGFVAFHEAFEKSKAAIPDGHLLTISYEDLVRDPKAVLRRIYVELALGDWAPVEGPLDDYLAARKDYKTNEYTPDEKNFALINEQWGMYFDLYGYEKQENATQYSVVPQHQQGNHA